MYFQSLIAKSIHRMEALPLNERVAPSLRAFEDGARWMWRQNNMASNVTPKPIATFSYTFYGIIKYGISISAMLLSAAALFWIHPVFILLSVIIFYWAEVHFLFLFPLLIEGVQDPLKTSIRATYKVGFFRALANVIPIALYMLSGLFDQRHPFKKWHIGCICILIWYDEEVRDRL